MSVLGCRDTVVRSRQFMASFRRLTLRRDAHAVRNSTPCDSDTCQAIADGPETVRAKYEDVGNLPPDDVHLPWVSVTDDAGKPVIRHSRCRRGC